MLHSFAGEDFFGGGETGWWKATCPLICTHFNPTIFLNFQKQVVVSHRVNESIYLAYGISSDTSWKRATQVVTVRHKGKRIAVSEWKETAHG